MSAYNLLLHHFKYRFLLGQPYSYLCILLSHVVAYSYTHTLSDNVFHRSQHPLPATALLPLVLYNILSCFIEPVAANLSMSLVVCIIQNIYCYQHQKNSVFVLPRPRSGAQEELQLLQKSCNVVHCLFNSPQVSSLPALGRSNPPEREDTPNLLSEKSDCVCFVNSLSRCTRKLYCMYKCDCVLLLQLKKLL